MSLIKILKENLITETYFNPNKRIHLSSKEITEVYDTDNSSRTNDEKPLGLWYGFSEAWVKFSKQEFGSDNIHHFSNIKFAYDVKVINTNIIVLKDIHDVSNFTKSFASKGGTSYTRIDWSKVSKEYSGIEIPTYKEEGMYWYSNKSPNYNWLSAWDVASGCIWNKEAVRKLRPMSMDSFN